ncbi:MAG: hypothetical protein HY393_04100 [Candidatus Diapherotrites archaeon]|nr:hypothetical protein [Candidatus Diapherotrites archaeon]
MPSTQRGQLLSLDFLISIGLAFLAVGTLFAWHELSTLNAKEAELHDTLNAIALNAGNALTDLDGWRCSSNVPDDNTTFPACIVDQHLAPTTITKATLGIPGDYNYTIIGLETDEKEAYDTLSGNAYNIMDYNRTVLYVGPTSPGFTLERLQLCMTFGEAYCPWKTKSIELRVWRN